MNKHNIIGSRIAEVRYSELNDPEGQWEFDGFDTVDCGIHIRMDNDTWWNFRWTDDEVFELDEGMNQPMQLGIGAVKTWDVTDRWKRYRDQPVRDLEISYVDEEAGLVDRCTIVFDDDKRVTLLVAEELTPGEAQPASVEYDMGGHLYVFNSPRLLRDVEAEHRDRSGRE